MVTIREINMLDYLHQASELARLHWQETEAHMSGSGPNLQVDAYRSFQDAGLIIAFGVFDDETLVGYCIAILSPHLHYGFMYAHHDVLFLKPEYRKGATALRLVALVHQHAKEKGAKCVTWHAKLGTAFHRILEHSAKPEETVFLREL